MPSLVQPRRHGRSRFVAVVVSSAVVCALGILGITNAMAATAGPIIGVGGRCVDVPSADTANGTPVQLYDCNNHAAQRWTVGNSDNSIQALGKCLDVAGGALTDGAQVQLYDCNGTGAQKWTASSGRLLNPQSGKCLDAFGNSSANGTRLVIWSCHGGGNQAWTLPGGGTTPPTGSTTSPGEGALTTVGYPGTDAVLANPDRGFMRYADCGSAPLSADTLAGYRADGVTQVFCMIYLRNFRTGDLDAAILDLLQRQFDAVRAAGLTTVLRFAYTDSSTGDDAAPAQVLRHIAQLKPLLQNNAYIISVVQAGFVGAWGEWYYTQNFGNQGRISATDQANRKAVVDALLDALPATRMVQLRTPGFKRTMYGTAALTSGAAYSGTAAARVAHHNDCFLASADDLGTYVDPAAERPYLAAETLHLPMGGETCAVNPPRSECAGALAELARFHWSYLNADYHPDVLASWRSGGCMTEIERRLGYRFTLTEGGFGRTAARGGTLPVRISIRNDGFAAPYNPRLVQLVLRDGAGTLHRLPLNADPRRWLPGTTTTVEQNVTLPANLPAGTYRLGLALPDGTAALAQLPQYSVQTANAGLWNAAGGYNDLTATVTVS